MELKVRTIGYMETWDGIFKRSMRNNNKKILSLLSIVLGLRGLYGLPEGTEPISGGGSFASEGNTMTITAPDGSVFSHGSFNVNSGETVQFVQPSVNARVLNRITSSSVSTINGTVEANGKLYFAAPGGLIFGEGSVIQARHLQAVAGAVNESNWDQSPQFSGTIENRGTINADSIVLGGETVSNRGTLSAKNGSILLVAGGGMEISSLDGSRVVQLSDSLQTSESMAGDLYGHALLESGILEALDVQVTASSVTNKGTISSSKVVFSELTELSGNEGAVHASEVVLEGKANRFPDVSMTGTNNQISKVTLNGSYNDLKIRSAQDLQIQAVSQSQEISIIKFQNGDFRTDSGDLSLNISFSPIINISDTETDSSLILASKTGSVNLSNRESISGYDQVVVYANNVLDEVSTGLSFLNEDWFVLNATSLEFDSLKPGLDAQSIFLLEAENPSLNLTGNELISGGSSDEQSVQNYSAPSLNEPGAGSEVTDSGGTSGSVGDDLVAPVGTPSLGDLVSNQSDSNRLSVGQLESAMSVGLYSDHSYLLQSIPADEYTLLQLAEAGGTSLLFGGSFDTVGSGDSASADTSTTESDTDSTDSSAQTTDESDSGEGESEASEDGATKTEAGDAKANAKTLLKRVTLGSAPLSPISRPVLSPQASDMLKQALTPQIEETLKGFSDR